jgi:hypothetical protein
MYGIIIGVFSTFQYISSMSQLPVEFSVGSAEVVATPNNSRKTSDVSSRKYFALLGFLPTVHKNTSAEGC